MEHTFDGIKWRHRYQNGKIWLNGDWIAVNSQERVLSIINIFKQQFYVKKRFLLETKNGHYSETLIMKAAVSTAARRCAFWHLNIIFNQ